MVKMRIFWVRLTVLSISGLTLLTILWMVAAYSLQKPIPYLIYTTNFTLYQWEFSCPSPMMQCAHKRQLLDNLYSIPVAQPSPDGVYVAVHTSDNWVIYPTRCLFGDQQCQPVLMDNDITDVRVTWGPDGSLLAYMVDQSILRLRSRGCWDGSPPRACLIQDIQLGDKLVLDLPAWSTDGSRIVLLGVIPRQPFVLETACFDAPKTCADQLRAIPVTGNTPSWVNISPDGQTLLYTSLPQRDVARLWLLDIASGSRRSLILEGNEGSVPSWSADGRYVAYSTFERRFGINLSLYAIDMQRGIRVRVTNEPSQTALFSAWVPVPR